jgi:hypothetical protein
MPMPAWLLFNPCSTLPRLQIGLALGDIDVQILHLIFVLRLLRLVRISSVLKVMSCGAFFL